MPIPVHFSLMLAQVVRKSRERSGMSQDTLAAKSGVSKRFLRDLEHARTDISVTNLLRISQALNLNMSELFLQVECGLTEQPEDG